MLEMFSPKLPSLERRGKGWLITRGEFILVASLEIILKIIFKIIID